MNPKVLATLLLLSFVTIFLGLAYGDLFYSVGALGTLIFGGLALSRLYRANHRDWYPYLGAALMLIFWSFAIIAPDGLELLAPIYLVSGIFSSVKLYLLD